MIEHGEEICMPADDFKLERYKYINGQLAALNESVHKYLLFYQTLAAAIVGGVAAFIISAPEHDVAPAISNSIIRAAGWLLFMGGLFTSFLVGSSILSWFDYRKEECELLDQCVAAGWREKPKALNFWRWPETWILLLVLLATLFLWCILRNIAEAVLRS
jgi:hypothetical protein